MTSLDAGDSFRIMPTDPPAGDDLDATTEVDDDDNEFDEADMYEGSDWVADELPKSMRGADPARDAAAFRERFEERYFEIQCSDVEIAAAAEIMAFAAYVVSDATPVYRDVLSRMAGVLRELDGVTRLRELGGVTARRAAAVKHVKEAIARFKEAKDEDEKLYATAKLFSSLSHYCDDRFNDLNFQKVRVELSRSGKRTASRIAAALAVSVGAFDDDNEESSRKAFLGAVKLSVLF